MQIKSYVKNDIKKMMLLQSIWNAFVKSIYSVICKPQKKPHKPTRPKII
jgi:hypothetical protein